MSPDGNASSNAPNIDDARAVKSRASERMTHWFERAAPISEPVNTEMRPIGVKSAAMPRTKAPESIIPRTRDLLSPVAPKIDTVIGTIG